MAFDSRSSERPLAARAGTRIGICVSRFHEDLTGAMLASAQAELARAGIGASDVLTLWVPGSFELPLGCRRLAARDDVQAVLAFGLVLRGETRHDEVVADSTARGLMRVMLECDKPVLLGVLTCATLEQARARALPVAAGGREDKGREVARAALETLVALEGLAPASEPLGFGRRAPGTRGTHS